MAEESKSPQLDRFLPPGEQTRVVDAIRAAETQTSGQVKVHIEPRGPGGDPTARAQHVFHALQLDKTKARNAVLIYVASDERRFAIVGDEGIHKVVGDDFWKEAAATMTAHFQRGAFGEGLCAAIGAVGERLRAKFPHEKDGNPTENELSDEISTAKVD